MKEIKGDLNDWSGLLYSQIGRTNIVNMSIFPKLIELTQFLSKSQQGVL